MAGPRVYVHKRPMPDMTFAEYFDLLKVGIYLQDVSKVILDRREDKPLELLAE